MNILLLLRYNGANYAGWQRQENAVAVQAVVEDALAELFGEKIILHGCGRTDARVHAFRQYANFHIDNPKISPKDLPYALKGKLPKDISCREAIVVSDAFHARKSAKEKEYRYFFYTDRTLSPFLSERAQYIDFDSKGLSSFLKLFLGRHDFSAFVCLNNPKRDPELSPIRTITSIGVRFMRSANAGFIYIKSPGFLYKMVRRIVGCCFDASKGRISEGKILDMLKTGKRTADWNTAPANGLYLWDVKYCNDFDSVKSLNETKSSRKNPSHIVRQNSPEEIRLTL